MRLGLKNPLSSTVGLGVAAGLVAAGALSGVALAGKTVNGPFSFDPIPQSANTAAWNPAAPWVIPAGFSQYVVSDESDLNIYQVPAVSGDGDDWHDMNTVNETGKHAGRYLYRTHEVRGGNGGTMGGVVSVVDLHTGETRVLVGPDPIRPYQALDGIRWTPWGTLLFAEEATGGRLLEVTLDPKDPMTALSVTDRPAVGRLIHEGIEIGPDGAVYVVDEFRGQRDGFGGGVYKFVPDRRGDLSSGKLYALKVTGPDGAGQGEWVGPIDPLNAAVDGTARGGTGWNRPEDIEIIGHTLYVAVTEGRYAGSTELYDGRVLAIDLNNLRVTDFVKPGVNVPVETSTQTGFDNPDNLAESPDGDLVIIEDNVPSDIWWAAKDLDGDGAADAVHLFASLSDPGAEGTGIYWGKDPHTMFVNVQHSAAPDGDGTWAITNRK